MGYRFLMSQMVLINISTKEVANTLGLTHKHFKDKLNRNIPPGAKYVADFTLPEARQIQTTYFPDIQIDELFQI